MQACQTKGMPIDALNCFVLLFASTRTIHEITLKSRQYAACFVYFRESPLLLRSLKYFIRRNRIPLDASLPHQSIDYFVHKKAARSRPQSATDTGVAHKPGTLPCADATACDVRDARRVRAAAQKYLWEQRRFVRPGRAMLPPTPGRRNPLPDCRPAMNKEGSVSSLRPGSPRQRRRCSQLRERG